MSATFAIPFIALLAVLLMMLVESQLSRFNERTLRARGATEPAGDVYPTMTWVYPACFVAMSIEGALTGPAPGPNTLLGVALFGVAKALKFWAIATLGPRWTFRVLVLPGAPLVRGGPYAWVRHPNYVAVIGEFVSFAILGGAPLAGILSVVVFGVLLRRRIRVEERALGISGPERV
jgi:methyltransferase